MAAFWKSTLPTQRPVLADSGNSLPLPKCCWRPAAPSRVFALTVSRSVQMRRECENPGQSLATYSRERRRILTPHGLGFPSSHAFGRTEVAVRCLAKPQDGAGDGNRTHHGPLLDQALRSCCKGKWTEVRKFAVRGATYGNLKQLVQLLAEDRFRPKAGIREWPLRRASFGDPVWPPTGQPPRLYLLRGLQRIVARKWR